jgi:hypothetical protein
MFLDREFIQISEIVISILLRIQSLFQIIKKNKRRIQVIIKKQTKIQ